VTHSTRIKTTDNMRACQWEIRTLLTSSTIGAKKATLRDPCEHLPC